MRKKPVLLFVVVVLSTLTFAQRSQRQSAADGAQTGDETCAFTFKSGSGHGAIQFCVTGNGNIAQFSAVGGNLLPQELISGVQPAIEGYGICDVSTLTNYWDFAQTASSNWNPATAVLTNPKTVTVTRTTADGVWKLVQTITHKPGSRTAWGAARISMALTNLSATDRIVILERHVNIDAGGSFFNDFDTTNITVSGSVPHADVGLSSTAAFLTTKFDFSLGFVMTVPFAPTPCIDPHFEGAQNDFFQGDGAALQWFDLEIGPGMTKTAAVTYKPI